MRFKHHDGSVCRLNKNSVWEIESLPRGMDLNDPEKVGEPCPHCNRYLYEDPTGWAKFDRLLVDGIRTPIYAWLVIGWSIFLFAWNGAILALSIEPLTIAIVVVLTAMDLLMLVIGVRGLRWSRRRSGRAVKESSTPPK